MNENYALTHLYHPGTGAKVSIPLDLAAALTTAQAKTLITSVDNLLLAGFTVNLPGLEDGENFEQIGFVVRREKENEDKTVTPVIDLYPAQGNFRVLGIYLNTAEEEIAFQQATGLKIFSLPLYDGNPIERGKNTKNDRFVTTLKSPAKAVWKLNPKWEGENDKKHAKRSFIRWEGLRPANIPAASALPIPPAMTYEQARAVKTPNGTELGTLDDEKLTVLANSKAPNVTAEMVVAASIILEELKKEGA
jgi:hypothetical protein